MDTGHIARELNGAGFVVVPDALPGHVLSALSRNCDNSGPGFAPASIGRGAERSREDSIRGDVVRWLSDANDVDEAYLRVMETLRAELNEQLFLGLFDYECHYAIYEAGARYQKHSDVLHGKDARLLSTVIYLNDSWAKDAGGELILYRGDDPKVIASILPQPGSMVLFLSADFPHEVLPASKPRHSIAGWYRGRIS